jgi:predicted transcriptional regulator of viral defense system
MQAAGKIVRPSAKRNFFVIVPPEYRSIGGPPVAWWLDSFMVHVGHADYYVGLLTAAEWHGSAHYAVQETQVVVPAQVRPVRIGREHIRFVTKSDAGATPVVQKASEGGSVRVSTPEATAVDLVRYARVAGGPSRIATVLSEMALSGAELHSALEIASDVTAAQRLGYLLDVADQHEAAQAVARYMSAHDHRIRPLVPGAPVRGAAVAEPWGVVVNASVEVG